MCYERKLTGKLCQNPGVVDETFAAFLTFASVLSGASYLVTLRCTAVSFDRARRPGCEKKS